MSGQGLNDDQVVDGAMGSESCRAMKPNPTRREKTKQHFSPSEVSPWAWTWAWGVRFHLCQLVAQLVDPFLHCAHTLVNSSLVSEDAAGRGRNSLEAGLSSCT